MSDTALPRRATPGASRSASPALSTYELLREAILTRRQVWAVYQGLRRGFCPHLLGAKGSELHCLGYQFLGESASGAIMPSSTDNWRCFAVDGLSEVSLREGPWFTAVNWDRRQACVDWIDVEVVNTWTRPTPRFDA